MTDSQASQENPSTHVQGILYGVGVGPGDPSLITVKGVQCIQNAPVIAFPAGIRGKLGVAEQITHQWCLPHQERLALDFPYVQDEEQLVSAWTTAADEVIQRLNDLQDVAFLCEGDISFYSTFSHLAAAIRQHCPQVRIEAIPGISSPMAAAAAIQEPLTTQGQSLLVIPALYHIAELEQALDAADVVVLMKMKSVYPDVWKILHSRHLLHCSYVVEWATWPQQKVYRDLSDRPHLDLSYFSLLVIRQPQANPLNPY
ncbi:MAG: precorrin-2 C(20)-methyltransferase [Cyanobacteria bacterium J06627_8]